MRIIQIKKKMICLGASLGLAAILVGFLTEQNIKTTQEHMAQEVFRFHVLANSDSEEDQTLKMKVKENVISYMKKELPASESVEMTKCWASSHHAQIENVSRMTLRREGSNDKVRVEITKSYFPDKTYGDITFPRGEYDALRVMIGTAEGKNWWCVLYPNLCFIDAVHAVVPEQGKKELKNVLAEEEYEMVTALSKFKVKWFFFQ